jgi:hypothetical protein
MPSSSRRRSVNAWSSRIGPISLGRRKSYSVCSTGEESTGIPRSFVEITVCAGRWRMREFTESVPTVRYGCAPLPYGQASAPTFVAVVRTSRPLGESEYSMRSSTVNG